MTPPGLRNHSHISLTTITLTIITHKMQPQYIDLPKICDPRGNLTFVQGHDQVPFDIARAYWTYDVPGGEERGGHAHRVSQELIIAVGGSFDVKLFDGKNTVTYTLNRPYRGLLVPPGYWRVLDNFSSGSVCLVLTSTAYSEDDYIRDYNEFLSTTLP